MKYVRIERLNYKAREVAAKGYRGTLPHVSTWQNGNHMSVVTVDGDT